MTEQRQYRSLRVEDLDAFPDDDRSRELAAGVLVCEPRPGALHGRVMVSIATALAEHVRRHGLGVVLAGDPGFILHRDPDTLRGPDVAFVRKERYEALEDESQAIPGAPDLAVEILSPSDRPEEVHAKVADYLAAGALLVWVIDPQDRNVTCYRTLLAPLTLGETDELTAPGVLPGLRIKVRDLFDD